MKRFVFALVSLLTALHAESADDTIQQICTNAEPDDRFVFRLQESHEVQVCNLADFIEAGDECEFDYGGTSTWRELVDLNGDGHFDLIVVYSSRGIWRGDQPTFIFLNCGDNTFVKIMEDPFTSVSQNGKIKKNGMAQLLAVRVLPIGNDRFNFQKILLDFDAKSKKYKIIRKGNKSLMTDKDEEEFNLKKASQYFDVIWNVFPEINTREIKKLKGLIRTE
jgi:hypothetical protein